MGLTMEHEEQPQCWLTIVLPTRNDDYNPDTLYRLATTLNLAGFYLAELDALDRVEIIVVDFKSETPLSEVVALTEEARAITSFISVPLDPAEHGSPVQFLCSTAPNVGIRRARGQFVLCHAADLLMGHSSWKSLLDLLPGKRATPFDLSSASLMLPRRSVPPSFTRRKPDVVAWDRWLKLTPHSSPFMGWQYPHICMGLGGLLASKASWFDLGGFDERFDKQWWNDVDFGIRASLRGPLIDSSAFGIYLFKPEHDPLGKRTHILTNPNSRNPQWTTLFIRANDLNWGMATESLRVEKSSAGAGGATARFNDPMDVWFEEDAHAPDEVWASRLQSESNLPILRTAIAPTLTIPRSVYDRLQAIAWYCGNRFPRMILEVGHKQPAFNLHVFALTVPASELYLVEHVSESVIGRFPDVVNTTQMKLTELGFVGHLRALAGDVLSSLDTLSRTVSGGLCPELTVVNLDTVGPNPLEVISRVMSICRKPMATVLSSDSQELLLEATNLAGTIGNLRTVVVKFGLATYVLTYPL